MHVSRILTATFGMRRIASTADDLPKFINFAEPWIVSRPGDPSGEIIVGRPLKFGEELKSVTYKDTAQRIKAMDKRAASMGLSRSDYLRYLVRRDLELSGME